MGAAPAPSPLPGRAPRTSPKPSQIGAGDTMFVLVGAVRDLGRGCWLHLCSVWWESPPRSAERHLPGECAEVGKA